MTGFREASWDKGTAGAGGALFGKRALVVAGAAGGGGTGVLGAWAAGAGVLGEGAALEAAEVA